MSGGYFDYAQYRIRDIADEIEYLIKTNRDETKNNWGDKIGHFYTEETIYKFKVAVNLLKGAEIFAQRIDWLISGDENEDTFHKRLEEDLDNLQKEMIKKYGNQ